MKKLSFQSLISQLLTYWSEQGCTVAQPIDQPVGAGTSHPLTFFGAILPQPIALAYVQPCRRPTDGRYGQNPNRLQHYYQFQVLFKPTPQDGQALYLASLGAVGLDLTRADLRFVEDNWENPSLGACGLGWEVWLNGMEISQITYFQQMGGVACSPACLEITYGLERIAMAIQGVASVYEIIWAETAKGLTYYGDLFQRDEYEYSKYQFELSEVEPLRAQFEAAERQAKRLLIGLAPLCRPAYTQLLQAAHLFNLLDARKALSVPERQRYLLKIRELSTQIAQAALQANKSK